MKKLSILLLLVSNSFNLFAQFKLSGKIQHYTGNAELKINIPVVYGFDEANSIKIPVKKDGSFSIDLPVKNQKFADLIFQQTFHLILLDAGKSLKVELSETDKSFALKSGTALAENSLLQKVNIEEYPFFLKDDYPYGKQSPAELNNNLIKPYYAARDRKITLVNQSPISPKTKKLIIGEIKSAVYNNLYELVLFGGPDQQKMINLVISAFDQADPNPTIMPAGPQYYLFAHCYLWYKQTRASIKVKSQNIKPGQLMPDYNITVAEFNALSGKYGQLYINWLTASRFLPNAVVEQLGYKIINSAVKGGNKDLINELVKSYKRKFPNSQRLAAINKQLAGIKK